MRTQVGIVLLDAAAPFEPLRDVAGSARYAEQVGLDSLWAGDHLVLGDAPLLDSTLTLAAAAAVTRDMGIGSAVFLPALRPLVWAGRQAGRNAVPPGCREVAAGRGRWCGSRAGVRGGRSASERTRSTHR